MSVIIFMWSQGFLSQTSSATGGQQGAQNQAAQSSINIEIATFSTGSSSSITVIVRNVGAVTINVGGITVTGSSSNSGFKGSIIATASGASFGTPTVSDGSTLATTGTGTLSGVSKGSSVSIKLSTVAAGASTTITSGDVINMKITTTVGTFGQAQFTAP